MKKFKKIFIAVGVFFFLLIAAAVIIPLVVDVDKYRPLIVQKANEQLNGKLELGKLTLSLWGKILVRVDGLNLKDQRGASVVSVNNAYFHLPFTSVFSGSPELVFKMDQPLVSVVKDKNGEMNVMKLVKKADAKEGTQSGSAGQTTQPGQGKKPSDRKEEVVLPAMATRARLGIELKDAKLSYVDQMTGMKNELTDLNLVARDISLSRETEIELWGDLNTQGQNAMQVKGPFKVSAQMTPKLNGAEFERLTASMKGDFDKLEMIMPGTFHKSGSIPANFKLEIDVSKNEAKIQKLLVIFHNVEFKGAGVLSRLNQAPASPVVQFEAATNEFAMAPWNELIPSLKEFELSGSTGLAIAANGPSDKLNYDVKLAMKNWSAKGPNLKAKPVINGNIHVVTDEIKNMLITMTAPGNDLKIQGNMVSLTQPRLTVDITSTGMDLDQLIDFPPPAKASESKSDDKAAAPSGGETSPSSSKVSGKPASAQDQDKDAMVAAMKKNPMMEKLKADLSLRIPKLKAQGITITDIQAKAGFTNLVASISTFGMNLWSGKVGGSFSTDLKPKAPTYSLKAAINDLDMRQAVSSKLELFKNTVVGKLDFQMAGQGASFNADAAMKNLNVKGNMKVENALFTSIDIGKMVTEAINGALGKVAQKFPGLAGKKISGLPKGASEYQVISSDFTIVGGKFSAPNFVVKAKPNQGVDLNGSTQVGMIDYSLDAKWKISDTYNMTKARDLSVDVSGVTIENILAEGNPPVVSFPVSVGCKLNAPCYSYGEVPEHFTKVALNNSAGAAKKKLKAVAKKKKKQVIDQGKKKVEEQLKNNPAAKDLLKKFGF